MSGCEPFEEGLQHKNYYMRVSVEALELRGGLWANFAATLEVSLPPECCRVAANLSAAATELQGSKLF